MKKKTSISKNYIPQSNYRNSAEKLLTEIDTKITAIGIKNPHKETLINKIKSIATLIHKIVTTKEQYEKKVVNEVIQLLFKSNKSSPEKSLEKQWEKIEAPVINILKVHYLNHYINQLLLTFEQPISFLVSKYKRYLPGHISLTEGDDLGTIAQLELIETFKAWNPTKNETLWPLAYTRINGAMKDHIRYISKSDPTRFYDWVTDAATLYLSINEDNSYEKSIENSSDLTKALKVLNEKEKQVVTAYIREDITFGTIAKRMNISESQISRIYKKSVEKIKSVLT